MGFGSSYSSSSEESEGTQILGDWDDILNQDTCCDDVSFKDKETTTRERGSTSSVGKRVLPPSFYPSYEWGNGLWKLDGRTLRKMKNKDIASKKKNKDIASKKKNKDIAMKKNRENVEKNRESESDEEAIPFKEIFAALIRNSGEVVDEEEEEEKDQRSPPSCVEMLKMMGLKFP
ncbi:unnamed protein product [Cochlearia groenlandica]